MTPSPPHPGAEPELADSVAEAALSAPGVAGLHPGSFGEVATYLPGRRVEGVRLRDEGVEVHVMVHAGVDVLATAGAVRGSVARVVAVPIDVFVEDVAPPSVDVD